MAYHVHKFASKWNTSDDDEDDDNNNNNNNIQNLYGALYNL